MYVDFATDQGTITFEGDYIETNMETVTVDGKVVARLTGCTCCIGISWEVGDDDILSDFYKVRP